MKNLILVLLVAYTNILSAQTVDEIISKYSTAMGGLDAFNKVESAKISGSLISQGKSFPLAVYILNGKSMKTVVDVNGEMVTNAYDKGKGWKVNPFENIPVATEIKSPDDLAALKTQVSLANNLMDYKKRGHQVEFLGQEEVDGVKTYKISLISKDDRKQTFYFIRHSDFMLVRSDSKQMIQGTEFPASTFYSDIKVINGLKFIMSFARKIEGKVFQEVKYDKVELNVAIDEKIFKKPD